MGDLQEHRPAQGGKGEPGRGWRAGTRQTLRPWSIARPSVRARRGAAPYRSGHRDQAGKGRECRSGQCAARQHDVPLTDCRRTRARAALAAVTCFTSIPLRPIVVVLVSRCEAAACAGWPLSYPGSGARFLAEKNCRIYIPCKAVICDIRTPLVAKAGRGLVAMYQCARQPDQERRRNCGRTRSTPSHPPQAPAVSFSCKGAGGAGTAVAGGAAPAPARKSDGVMPKRLRTIAVAYASPDFPTCRISIAPVPQTLWHDSVRFSRRRRSSVASHGIPAPPAPFRRTRPPAPYPSCDGVERRCPPRFLRRSWSGCLCTDASQQALSGLSDQGCWNVTNNSFAGNVESCSCAEREDRTPEPGYERAIPRAGCLAPTYQYDDNRTRSNRCEASHSGQGG